MVTIALIINYVHYCGNASSACWGKRNDYWLRDGSIVSFVGGLQKVPTKQNVYTWCTWLNNGLLMQLKTWTKFIEPRKGNYYSFDFLIRIIFCFIRRNANLYLSFAKKLKNPLIYASNPPWDLYHACFNYTQKRPKKFTCSTIGSMHSTNLELIIYTTFCSLTPNMIQIMYCL